MQTKPTHEQAQLHLQIYEMRREPRLRQARDWFFKNYFVEKFEDNMRVAAPGTEGGTFTMMVLSYWEQACALLNSGLLHEELFFHTSGECFGVWERIKAVVPEARQIMKYNVYMAEMEKAAQRYQSWMEQHSPGHLAVMREWMKQMQAQMAKAA
jgi:aspartyl/asparaginyl-tRNA synthetase